MSDLDPDEQLLLSRARAGLSPASNAEARVRRSIAAILAGGSLPEAPGNAPAADAGSGGWNAVVGRTAGWTSRLLVAAAIAGAAGTTGYWLGHRAGQREAHVASSASLPSAVTLSREGPPAAEPPAAPADVGGPPAHEVTGGRVRRDPTRAAPATSQASAAESLAREVTALRGIERALRDEQPGLALALLQELDRAVPDGKLLEEREATGAIARCALGRVPLGVDLAEDFAEHHPDSVYRTRVEQSCASRRERRR